MKIIIGLGNPGKEYENTRHNIGFMVLDNYLKDAVWQQKFNALYTNQIINGEKVLFIKPQTYMNLSGNAVKQYVDYFKIDIKDILVIQDDLDLDVGKFRIKINSSSGGHNGIKSIIERLGSNQFTRLKIGISNTKLIDTKDYVLGRFTHEELVILKDLYLIFDNIIKEFSNKNIEELMNKYNRK